jgi:hypothetical protein
VNLETAFPPIAESDLVEFEQATGLRLVPQYRNFLLAHNGGRPDDNVVDVPGLGEVAVNDFLGLMPGDSYDLRSGLEVYEGRIPAGSLPVAEDPGGNLFLLALGGESTGAVYYWDHEDEPADGAADWSDFGNVHEVAGSFDEFLSRLRPAED